MPSPEKPSSSAERLFADWLAHSNAPDPEHLERLCAEHPERAEELRAMQAQWARIDSIVQREVPAQGHDESGDGQDLRTELLLRLARCGESASRYHVEGEVGRGSMGAVLRVHDEQLGRYLAMKVALGARDASGESVEGNLSVRQLARFLQEAEVTGQLDHPGIVPVHELGLDADGRVYFTMKLVEGKTLREVFDELARGEGDWTQTRVLGLLLKICDAMSYAHAKGVIHRDLKPGNVMVGQFGEVYVMDWGLAKITGREDEKDIRVQGEGAAIAPEEATEVPDSPLVTMDGDVVGTPAYMSPEQAGGRIAEMGPHSDVYSVGAMLYHLLAGHMPYVRTGETGSSRDVWQAVKRGAPLALARETRTAPVELVAICERAMSREALRRYGDMAALGEDLRAYLEHRVVHAYRTGAMAELRKWVERNKLLAGSLSAALLALIIGAVLYVAGITRAQAETEVALNRTRALGLASASFAALEEDTMLALLLAREAVALERTPETLSRVHQAVGVVRESGLLRHGDVLYDAVFSPSGDALVAISRLSALVWDFEREPTRLEGHTGWLTRAAFNSSGEEILTAAQDGTARVWNREGEELVRFVHRAGSWITAAWSPNDYHVLTAGEDGTAMIWERDSPSEPLLVLPRRHTASIGAACFSPQGELVLTASEDRTAHLWRFHEVEGFVELVAVLAGHEGPITSASFSPDGERIVTASGLGFWGQSAFGFPDRTARVWDREGRPLGVLEDPSYGIQWAGFAKDGRRILTGSNGDGGRLWDAEGNVLQEYRMPRGSGLNWMCSASPDGGLVAFTGSDGRSYLFEEGGNPLGVLRGHDDQVLSARFSPDSRTIATSSLDGLVRLWRVRDDRLPVFRGHGGSVRAAFSPDGLRVATVAWDGTARIWDAGGEEFHPLIGHTGGILSVAFDRDGTRVVTASMDLTARIWDLEGTELAVLHHEPRVNEVRTAGFSPDGTSVVTGCRNGSVLVWNIARESAAEFPIQRSYASHVSHVEFAPDGVRVLVAKAQNPVLILTLADGSLQSLGHQGYHATFTLDGDVLIAGVNGRAVIVTDTGELVREVPGHETVLTWASLSRSGRRLVTAGRDGRARLWRVADQTLEAELRGHEGVVHSAVFSPTEEELVLTGAADGTARLWMADTEALLELAAERSVRDLEPDELVRYEELLGVPAREAQALVEELRDEFVLKERILARLRDDRDLDTLLRDTAVRMAESFVDSSWHLHQEAWSIVEHSDRTPEEYARGLRLATAACELRPDAQWMIRTHGAALYRVGRLDEACATLQRADGMHEPRFGDRRFGLLFLAMTEGALGRRAEAERLLDLVHGLSGGNDPEELLRLEREARERIGR